MTGQIRSRHFSLIHIFLAMASRRCHWLFQKEPPRSMKRLLLLFLLGSSRVPFVVAVNEDNTASVVQDCGAWFAPASIPGAGMGVYAGKNYKKGSVVLEGDISVPVIDLLLHNFNEDFNLIWHDYVWSGQTASMGSMGEEVDTAKGGIVNAASFGFGSAINSYLPLVNCINSTVQTDNAGLSRDSDPGAGAFTPYHDRKTIATQDIEQGAELFVNYGQQYFVARRDDYGMVPLTDHYKIADKILNNSHQLLQKLERTGHSNRLLNGLWEFVTFSFHDGQSRVLNALPKNRLDIPKINKIGTAKLYYERSVKSLQWLQQNGKCVDNLYPAQSTIPQAGRGAFASRFLKKGSIVAPCPLIHIVDSGRMNIYETYEETTTTTTNGTSTIKRIRNESCTTPVHQQLLVNYCFGHVDSTLLLSMYGVMVGLINHSSQKFNAEIRWAAPHTMRHPEWLQQSLYELQHETHVGLAFDIVALRDIQPGEEVFINYGQEWEEAWKEHVRNWKPPKSTRKYQYGYEMNNDMDLILWPYNTKPYYASTLQVMVHDAYVQMSGVNITESNNTTPTTTTKDKKKKKDKNHKKKDKKEEDDATGSSATPNKKPKMHLARIVQRHENDEGPSYLYTAELIDRVDDKDTCEEVVTHVLFGLPRDAFYFRDEPYSRDIQMHTAFRHPIMIPDAMFPDAWRNKKQRNRGGYQERSAGYSTGRQQQQHGGYSTGRDNSYGGYSTGRTGGYSTGRDKSYGGYSTAGRDGGGAYGGYSTGRDSGSYGGYSTERDGGAHGGYSTTGRDSSYGGYSAGRDSAHGSGYSTTGRDNTAHGGYSTGRSNSYSGGYSTTGRDTASGGYSTGRDIPSGSHDGGGGHSHTGSSSSSRLSGGYSAGRNGGGYSTTGMGSARVSEG